MKIRISTVIMIFWSLNYPALAQVGGHQVASELEAWCQILDTPPPNAGASEVTHAAMCLAYLGGLADGMGIATDFTKRDGKKMPVCFPENVNSDQLRRIYLKHLSAMPENLNETARIVAAIAFVTAFRCSDK